MFDDHPSSVTKPENPWYSAVNKPLFPWPSWWTSRSAFFRPSSPWLSEGLLSPLGLLNAIRNSPLSVAKIWLFLEPSLQKTFQAVLRSHVWTLFELTPWTAHLGQIAIFCSWEKQPLWMLLLLLQDGTKAVRQSTRVGGRNHGIRNPFYHVLLILVKTPIFSAGLSRHFSKI